MELRAVLSQEVEGEEHPVMYISWKLFPWEQNYSVIEKEVLTIQWAVDAITEYLLSSLFVFIIDHTPLRWLNTMKSNNARLMHW